MRDQLKSKGYSQIPQLTASKPIDVTHDFDLVPPEATGTRRAVMIGINYVGHEQGVLSGCHNDCMNMKKYIQKVHKFQPNNITVLMDDDDGEHKSPTRANILSALKKMVQASEPGDALFVHYSGHGAKIKDDSGYVRKSGTYICIHVKLSEVKIMITASPLTQTQTLTHEMIMIVHLFGTETKRMATMKHSFQSTTTRASSSFVMMVRKSHQCKHCVILL